MEESSSQVCKVACELISIIDIPERLFACCEAPKAIAADGIVLSVQSKHLAHLKQPWIWKDAPSLAKARATTPNTRTLPCADDERLLLAALTAGEATVSDLQGALDDGSVSSSGPRAVVALSLAYHSGTSQRVACPQGALDFARCMLREISPSIQLLPSATWKLVDSHLTKPSSPVFTMELFTTLSKYSPVMMRFLNCARNSPRSTRTDAISKVVTVFNELLDIS